MDIEPVTRFLEVVPIGIVGTVIVTIGRAIDTGVRADGNFLTAGVDALADCGLPPAGPAPVGMLAHVDTRDIALWVVMVGLVLGLGLGGLEIGCRIEGLVVPFRGVGQHGRCDVRRPGLGGGGCRDQGDGRDKDGEDGCVSEHISGMSNLIARELLGMCYDLDLVCRNV